MSRNGNGGGFRNAVIDAVLEAFGITCSLSRPGTPPGNAVAESMYNTLKIGLGDSFESLDDLELKLFGYVNRFNNVRLHGSLGYRTPAGSELPAWAGNPDSGNGQDPFQVRVLQ